VGRTVRQGVKSSVKQKEEVLMVYSIHGIVNNNVSFISKLLEVYILSVTTK
jgi:hypothetical protein